MVQRLRLHQVRAMQAELIPLQVIQYQYNGSLVKTTLEEIIVNTF